MAAAAAEPLLAAIKARDVNKTICEMYVVARLFPGSVERSCIVVIQTGDAMFAIAVLRKVTNACGNATLIRVATNIAATQVALFLIGDTCFAKSPVIGMELLNCALYVGDCIVAQALLRAGAAVSAPREAVSRAFDAVIISGCVTCAEHLCDAGLVPDGTNQENAVLHRANEELSVVLLRCASSWVEALPTLQRMACLGRAKALSLFFAASDHPVSLPPNLLSELTHCAVSAGQLEAAMFLVHERRRRGEKGKIDGFELMAEVMANKYTAQEALEIQEDEDELRVFCKELLPMVEDREDGEKALFSETEPVFGDISLVTDNNNNDDGDAFTDDGELSLLAHVGALEADAVAAAAAAAATLVI